MTALAVIDMNLRADDNPALHHAARQGDCVALFVQDTAQRPPGAAFDWWTQRSLEQLRATLEEAGIPLIAVRGRTASVVPQVVRALEADTVHANRRWGGDALAQDRAWAQEIQEMGVSLHGYTAHTIHDPWEISTGAGDPYRVFTPFSKRFADYDPQPLPPVTGQETTRDLFRAVADLDLGAQVQPTGGRPAPHWAEKFEWEVGEQAAHRHLEEFLAQDVEDYPQDRDVPSLDATSCLSPYLAHGEISPRRVIEAAQQAREVGSAAAAGTFISEVLWREFNYHLLYHYPDMGWRNLNPRFDAFPWREAQGETAERVEVWKSGHTGLPIVDAGMRQLWETGWMHNRIRMVVASALTKNAGVHWSLGEQWFWDTLVDADPASNPGNWQWVAGTGADAAPYFRIFSPRRQAERFDPHGEYIRTWVPELREVPAKNLMKAHEGEGSAPLSPAPRPAEPVELYPDPFLDVKASRRAALDAYETIKG